MTQTAGINGLIGDVKETGSEKKPYPIINIGRVFTQTPFISKLNFPGIQQNSIHETKA